MGRNAGGSIVQNPPEASWHVGQRVQIARTAVVGHKKQGNPCRVCVCVSLISVLPPFLIWSQSCQHLALGGGGGLVSPTEQKQNGGAKKGRRGELASEGSESVYFCSLHRWEFAADVMAGWVGIRPWVKLRSHFCCGGTLDRKREGRGREGREPPCPQLPALPPLWHSLDAWRTVPGLPCLAHTGQAI